MNRLGRLILVSSILFLVLFVGPAVLGSPFGLYPSMKNGDVLDLFTPMILIPLYWLLYQMKEDSPLSLGENLAFLILAVFWVEGQGMHLSAIRLVTI